MDNTLDFVIDGAFGVEMFSLDGSLQQTSGTSFASPAAAAVAAPVAAQQK